MSVNDVRLRNSSQATTVGDSTGLRGPLSKAMGEVDKLREIFQKNSYKSSSDDIFSEEDSWSTQGYSKQDELISCLLSMKELMEAAELESMRLKEEKRLLTKRIGESLNTVNLEMDNLRQQLKEQDRRLRELGATPVATSRSERHFDFERSAHEFAELEVIEALRNKNIQLENENTMLKEELYFTRSAESKNECSRCRELQEYAISLENRFQKSKDTTGSLRRERKQLKSEKLDLLNQLKQLYAILEDKEKELRDFILNYEQRMKDSEEAIKQLVAEKEKLQKERWEILKHATENSERCVTIKTELDEALENCRRKEEELLAAKGEIKHLRGQWQQGDRDSSSIFEFFGLFGKEGSTFRLDNGASYGDNDSAFGKDEITTASRNMPVEIGVGKHEDQADVNLESDEPPMVGCSTPVPAADTEYLSLGNPDQNLHPSDSDPRQLRLPSSSELSRPKTFHQDFFPSDNVEVPNRRSKELTLPKKSPRRRTFSGTLSKIFHKDKARLSSETDRSSTGLDKSRSPEEEIADKWNTWDSMQNVPMSQWKARAVLVWLEVECCMGMYADKCYENIKSGNVLLDMNENDLANALGITNPLHKLKLSLAVEEHKHPERKNTRLSKLDHVWVSYTWLRDIGLPQYCSVFEKNLVDGRMLDALSKKDLEKHLGMSKKFHQASFYSGLHLLKMFNYDREVLNTRRTTCNDIDIDIVVWTNERVARWVQSIDLKEYANNLQESGVHGAVMILDETFTSDMMATILGIPQTKQHLLKHLSSELNPILKSARGKLKPEDRLKNGKPRSSLSRSLSMRWSMRRGYKVGRLSASRGGDSLSKSTGNLPADQTEPENPETDKNRHRQVTLL